MSTKHSPWPWRWIPREEYNLPRLVDANGADVCHFGNDTTYYPSEGQEPDAQDAALIAAAPSHMPHTCAASPPPSTKEPPMQSDPATEREALAECLYLNLDREDGHASWGTAPRVCREKWREIADAIIRAGWRRAPSSSQADTGAEWWVFAVEVRDAEKHIGWVMAGPTDTREKSEKHRAEVIARGHRCGPISAVLIQPLPSAPTPTTAAKEETR